MDLRYRSRDYFLYDVDSYTEKCTSSDYGLVVPDALLGTSTQEKDFRYLAKKYKQNKWREEASDILGWKKIEPRSSRTNQSELWQTTKLASGCVDRNNKKNESVRSMIQKRQVGKRFTRSQQCGIIDRLTRYTQIDGIEFYGKVSCGVYSNSGENFLAATGDSFMRLYNTVSGNLDEEEIFLTLIHASAVLDTAFSADGNTFVWCGWSNSMYMISINDDWHQQALALYAEGNPYFCISSVAFSNDNNEIYASCSDGHLYVYDLEKSDQTLRVNAHSRTANAVRFAEDTSQVLITGGEDGICKVWDKRTLGSMKTKPEGVLRGHGRGITYIDPKGDGRYFITNSKDQTIKLWDLRVLSKGIQYQESRETSLLDRDTTSIMTYRGHSVLNTLMRCRFSPAATTSQQYIYTGSGDGRVILYDVLTGAIASHIERRKKTCVRDVSWHPYQPHLVLSTWDGSIETWTPAPSC